MCNIHKIFIEKHLSIYSILDFCSIPDSNLERKTLNIISFLSFLKKDYKNFQQSLYKTKYFIVKEEKKKMTTNRNNMGRVESYSED